MTSLKHPSSMTAWLLFNFSDYRIKLNLMIMRQKTARVLITEWSWDEFLSIIHVNAMWSMCLCLCQQAVIKRVALFYFYIFFPSYQDLTSLWGMLLETDLFPCCYQQTLVLLFVFRGWWMRKQWGPVSNRKTGSIDDPVSDQAAKTQLKFHAPV